jgi:hypothetical protein
MYLKNTSKTVTVVINTVVGKIGLKPGEVINLEHKLLPPVSAHIKKTTEEEYNNFRNPKMEGEEQTQTNIQPDENTNKQLDEVKNEKDVTQTITDGIEDDTAADFIKKLFTFNTLQKEEEETEEQKPDFESKGETPKTDPLIVKKTDSTPEIEELETQLKDLKEAWKEAKQVRKKDKIHKQIKEVQKQLDKLKKELDA